jgi:predicted unusual protein kinase regulating ubiquinone biosynthesis (AarF/ABC1/UbiB family)
MRREPTHGRASGAWADGAERVAESATDLLRNVGRHVLDLVEDAMDDSADVVDEAESLIESARERLDDARGAARAAPRATRVVGEGLALLARHRLGGALRAARRELTGRPEGPRDDLHRHTARRMRVLCGELRGGILKLGQFASTRGDVLPAPYVEELSKLQDRVPAVPAAEATARLSSALGDDWGERFASFEPVPLAAASLAQVHGATLADGTPVAVKLLVPGIEAVVESDLAALRALAPSVRGLLHRIDLDTLVAELSRSVSRELDLEAEARVARELRAAFADDPDVIVPAIHDEASGHGVLVMERIDGERLTDFLDACATRGEAGARDRDRVCETLVRCFCEQVLVHGLFQGDPHPGNFLVVPGPDGPRLALLDFGCIERYDAETRAGYAALAVAVLARDRARMAERFAALGFRSRDGGTEGLEAYAELFLSAFREGMRLDDEADHAARVRRILERTDADPITRIPGHFVLLGRVFAALGGLLMRYRPDLRLSELLRPGLAAALRTP